jgi:SAM-dependent methyltransferase
VIPKPRGLGASHAEQFGDPAVVAAYEARPPYPLALDRLFVELAGGSAARLLDLGCGTGELARRLVPRIDAIVAIDRSERMIARGRLLPNGDAPNLTWIHGRVEDVPIAGALAGPFTAALAAESFHWFDWQALAPRLAAWLPSRRLILAERREEPSPWSDQLAALIARYSTNQDFEPYDVVDELVKRRYLAIEGRLTVRPQPFSQSIDDYVTSIHSRNGFSRDRMTAAAARAFDGGVREAVLPHAPDGVVTVPVAARVVWGRVEAT